MRDLATRLMLTALLGMAGLGAWTAPGLAQTALQLDGSTQYVTFGPAPELGGSRFTVELWFKKTGAGVTVATHSGTGAGVTAVPLITKGRSEADGDTRDINYFLGIDLAGHLVADYEEGAGQVTPGLNHPVVGAAVISNDVWYHAAAVFDGASLRLYLNGNLDGVTTGLTGRDPRFDSSQQAALGTAFNTTGNAGYFAGVMDEARIWNVARTQCEVVEGVNAEIASGTGLVGRWGLNDGAGIVAVNSIEGSPDGALVNGPIWVTPGAPFDIALVPADPSGLSAGIPVNPPVNQIQLTWTDNSTNESGFEIERADGSGSPFTLLVTVGPNVNQYTDTGLSVGYEYCYRVRAVNCALSSAFTTPVCRTIPGEACNTLDFDPNGTGTQAYVSFGNPAALQLSAFTIELWLRRDGAGIGTLTASGGIADAVPLVTKGRSYDDVAQNNVNYFFAVQQSSGVLCADFEEGPGGTSPGTSHPVLGTTAIPVGEWHHAAVTYDGATWQLYLDGQPDGLPLAVNQPASNVSTMAVSLASAINALNVPAGYFDGALDEVRIWNVARSQGDIQGTMNQSIGLSTPGLVARWSLNETAGTTVRGSAGTGNDGTIIGTPGSNWSRGTCASWVTAVGDENPDLELALKPIAPNPARDHALLRFALPRAERVKLEILDIQGRRIVILADGDFDAGPHEFMWRGRGGSDRVQAGVYVVRFSAGGRVATRRMVMIR